MNEATSADVELVGRVSAVPRILRMMISLTGMRFSAVARVTDKKWIACAVEDRINFGLKPGGELQLETTICDEIRQHQNAVIFGQASADPHWSKHHTPKQYGLESYISIPIFRENREFFGTLCAIDPLPADLSDPKILETLTLFAELIGAQLDIESRLTQSEGALLDAKASAELQQQIFAVLGHDVRSPLQVIMIASNVLRAKPSEEKAQSLVNMIDTSCRRIEDIVKNTMDFARGKLGGGIPVSRTFDRAVYEEIDQVVREVRTAVPNVQIEVAAMTDKPVCCDAPRIAQLFGNLLNNAASHGSRAHPIRVSIDSDGKDFRLRVANHGTPIPESLLPNIFTPFIRGDGGGPGTGLGLGLYIAGEIARAHDGRLSVTSTELDGTAFTFEMPMHDLAVANSPT